MYYYFRLWCRHLVSWKAESIMIKFERKTANEHDINVRALKPEVTWPTGNNFWIRPKVWLLGCNISSSMPFSILYIRLDIWAILLAKTANALDFNGRALKPEVTWPTQNYLSGRPNVWQLGAMPPIACDYLFCVRDSIFRCGQQYCRALHITNFCIRKWLVFVNTNICIYQKVHEL